MNYIVDRCSSDFWILVNRKSEHDRKIDIMQHQNISSIFKQAANLNTFSGVMYSRQKLDLGRHRKVFTKRKRNCDLQPEFPVFSCKCVWEGRSRHGKHTYHITYHSPHRLLLHVSGCCTWKNNSSSGELWNFQISTGIYQCFSVLVG